MRNSLVDVTSHGHLAVIDGADSEVRYSAVNPVAGVTYPRLRSGQYFTVRTARDSETPTLNDLAYRSVDGSLPGLNLGLRPARSDNYETGIKAGNDKVRATVAAFYIKTTDELAVLQNSGGRAVDQNIGETTRRGLELETEGELARGGFSTRLVYTYIRAVVEQPYYTCVTTPCNPLANPAAPPAQLPAGAGGQLPACAGAKCLVRGSDLALCAAGIFDHPRHGGPLANLRK